MTSLFAEAFPGDQPPADPVNPAYDAACRVCADPIPWSGKGRPPTLCPEHSKKTTRAEKDAYRAKVGRAAQPTTGISVGEEKPKSSPKVERAVRTLRGAYGSVGKAVEKFVSPAAGQFVQLNRSDLAESYRLALETSPKFLAFFDKAETGMAWLPILAVHVDLGFSLMALIELERENNRLLREAAMRRDAGTYVDDGGESV